MLSDIKLGEMCTKYSRRKAVIYCLVGWATLLINFGFILYSMFFTGGYMDVILAPITVHVNVSDLTIPRVVFLGFNAIYLEGAFVFPQAMTFMLATIFSHQYRELCKSFVKVLANSDESLVSDADIETFRKQHQKISMNVKRTDEFLMFHNAGAFCCQLLHVILLLYGLIFLRSTPDLVVVLMHVFWMFSSSFGLVITAVGGIMVNHFVSKHADIVAITA